MKKAEQGIYASGQRGQFSLMKGGEPGRESGERESWRKLGIMTNKSKSNKQKYKKKNKTPKATMMNL